MKRICLISLGCVKNTVDSEAILGLFRNPDFEIVTEPENSDFIIINTCGFILPAKVEGINTILKMLTYKKKTIVVGCLVERYYEELKRDIPEVDVWVKFKEEYKELPKIIQNLCKEERVENSYSFSNRVLSTPRYTAYLKISEGCNNFCSFCAIPYIRGRFISYDEDELVNYTKSIVKLGVKEIVVIGQDPTSYGKDIKDKKCNLVTLLTKLGNIEGLEFIRTLYLYPEGINKDLLELFKNNPKFPHYFDIPIQHVTNKILKSMNRRDTKESMQALFKEIREYIPDAIFRTTLIVGYPGEKEADIDELMAFIKEIKFNHLGVFTYSREEGTRAYNLRPQVSEKVKNRRRAKVMEEQASISYELNKEMIGKTYKGIIIGKDHNDYLVRTVFNSPDDIDGNVFMKSNKNHKDGDIVNVTIESAFVYDLIGTEKE